MAIQFNEATNNTGICQQSRVLAGVDSTQWPTARIVNSVNNWHDFLTGYAIGADKRYQWDDTNHTILPEGTVTMTSGTSDYAFTTDANGNSVVTLLRIDMTDQNSNKSQLRKIDQSDIEENALANLYTTTGIPLYYDLIADNIFRVYPTPNGSGSLKVFFQRTGSYFAATDTTKSPGVSPLLHRGYVIAAAYDIALTLGLPTIQALSVEMEKEKQKVITYFAERNQDDTEKVVRGKRFNFRGGL